MNERPPKSHQLNRSTSMDVKHCRSPHWHWLFPSLVPSAMWAPEYVSAHHQSGACARHPRHQSGVESWDPARTPGGGLHGHLGEGARNWKWFWESDTGHLPRKKPQVWKYAAKRPRERGAAGDNPWDQRLQDGGQRHVCCDCDRSGRGQDQGLLHRQNLWYSTIQVNFIRDAKHAETSFSC